MSARWLPAVLIAVGCGGPKPVIGEFTPQGKIAGGGPTAPPSATNERVRESASDPLPGAHPQPEAPQAIDYQLLPPLDTRPIEARFAAAYGHAHRPRIAVFFNRTLSDEVREWVEPQRTTTTTTENKVITPAGGVITDRSTQASTTIPDARAVSDPRAPVGERMAWAVETSFSTPLLAQGVRLVDRATILRLVALASGKQGDPTAMMSVKEIEMSALVGHADYFVELLVSNATDSPLGYDLKATVKAVSTGQIVANLSTATWSFAQPPKQPPPARRAVATDHGYEYVDVPPPTPHAIYPTTTEVATRMADLVMQQLAGSLERGP